MAMTKNKDLQRFNYVASKKQMKELKEISTKTTKSVSLLIREAISSYLEKGQK